jgi:hypothetical protein
VVREFLAGLQLDKVSATRFAVDEVPFGDVITITAVVAHGACHLLDVLLDLGPSFYIKLRGVMPTDPQLSVDESNSRET